MISYPAQALRRSVHRRFVKGLPPGAVVVYVYGQTDEESFLVVLWSVVSCTHRRFFSGSHGVDPWFVRARFVK